jgi:putative ABC transport system ATP-binding protein
MEKLVNAAPDAPILEAHGLCKTYVLPHKKVPVLNGAGISVRAGELVSIVGLSGAGKSTLLHVLGGLDRPEAGEVIFEGRSIYALSPAKRTALRATGLGFVFQAYYLMPEMDIVENVMLPAMASGHLGRGAMRARAFELLDRVGLSARAGHTPIELSGGEQQRVAIARALAKNPKLLLCDEPTGALDYQTGKQILKLLQDTARRTGMTVIIITHNSALTGMADRIVRLKNGTVAEQIRNEHPVSVDEIEG